MKTFEQLKEQAQVISTEVNKGANTTGRVGGMMSDMLDFTEGTIKDSILKSEETTNEKLRTLDANVKNIDNTNEDGTLHIVDDYGNVLAIFGSNGLKVTSVSDKNGNTFEKLLELVKNNQLSIGNIDTKVNADIKEVNKKVSNLDNVSQSDAFYITDNDGHVLAIFDDKGLKAIEVTDQNGNSLRKLKDAIDNKGIELGLLKRYNNSLYITDGGGNVLAVFTPKGLSITSITDKEGNNLSDIKSKCSNVLYGKELVGLGDSLFASGQFLKELARISGAIWNEELNNSHYSVGGTKTVDATALCGQGRIKTLVAEGLVKPDYIVYENVNDSGVHNFGSKADESWFQGDVVPLDIPKQNDAKAAKQYFTDNFSTIAQQNTAQIGGVIGVPYNVSKAATKLVITHKPTASGDVTLKVGMNNVNIAVTDKDTIEDVVNKIIEYDFLAVIDDKINSSSVLFTPTYGTAEVTLSANSTGVTASIENNLDGSLFAWKYFLGHDISKWNNPSNWVDEVSLWAAWKGTIEYLMQHFPKAMIYWLIPKTFGLDFKDDPQYKRKDGTLDWDKIKNEKDYCAKLFEAQIDFCKYYEIPCIDVRQDSCMNVGNIESYMNNKNVHPKVEAYHRWANVFNRKIN